MGVDIFSGVLSRNDDSDGENRGLRKAKKLMKFDVIKDVITDDLSEFPDQPGAATRRLGKILDKVPPYGTSSRNGFPVNRDKGATTKIIAAAVQLALAGTTTESMHTEVIPCDPDDVDEEDVWDPVADEVDEVNLLWKIALHVPEVDPDGPTGDWTTFFSEAAPRQLECLPSFVDVLDVEVWARVQKHTSESE